MALYLLRHTSVSMPKGICYGNTDVGLADSFEQELEAVKKQLEGVAFSMVYSSPLTRCTRLAEAFSNNVIIDKRITEYSFGKWERVKWDDIYAQEAGKRWFDDYVNVPTPQGESYVQMTKRVDDFIADLPNVESQNVLVVTHAGIIRAFLVQLEGYSIAEAFDRQIAFGEVLKMHRSLRRRKEH